MKKESLKIKKNTLKKELLLGKEIQTSKNIKKRLLENVETVKRQEEALKEKKKIIKNLISGITVFLITIAITLNVANWALVNNLFDARVLTFEVFKNLLFGNMFLIYVGFLFSVIGGLFKNNGSKKVHSVFFRIGIISFFINELRTPVASAVG